MSEQTSTTFSLVNDVVVVRITDDHLDERNLSQVRAEVPAAGGEHPQATVALDLSNIDYMPSRALGGLVQIAQIFRARQQRLVLVGVQPALREVLAVTRLDRLFEMQPSLEAIV